MSVDEYYKNIDRKFRLPRIWSNNELKKFSGYFKGDVVNVSAWIDSDKEGGFYRNYFSNATSYSVTNYKAEARGFQGNKGEIYLNLEDDLPNELVGRFDVVFNHTTLEHIFDIHKAVENLCKMTKKDVIVVVPFLQEMHADYGDYWRFTPSAMEKLFLKNGLKQVHCSFNSHPNASVYLFCIATKDSKSWENIRGLYNQLDDPFAKKDNFSNWVGCNAIQNDKYNRRNSIKTKKNYLLSKIKKVINSLF